MEDLNLSKFLALLTTYLVLKILVIIASIVINQNEKFQVNWCETYETLFIFCLQLRILAFVHEVKLCIVWWSTLYKLYIFKYNKIFYIIL